MDKVKENQIYKHYKTKGLYQILHIGTLQAKEETGLDMKECVVYQSLSDQKVWVRDVEYFTEKVVFEDREVPRFALEG